MSTEATPSFEKDLEPFMILMETLCKRGPRVSQTVKLDEVDITIWSRLKPFLLQLPALLQTLEAKVKEADNIPLTKLDWYTGVFLLANILHPNSPGTIHHKVQDSIKIKMQIEQAKLSAKQVLKALQPSEKEQDNEPKNNDS